MKKLISLLACAALLVGLVIAVFPAMSGSADTSIQAAFRARLRAQRPISWVVPE